ncbi:DNA polymerase [Carboxydothermus islandicus]|uniref:DNA polymerase n=1 Tax=Carboxydothermus islandicus TaxID=661089 RepID=A0A1L8D1D9_9THEO|nr:non-homologous end-joining DNA ligase [Carboxydothermus islandicus]GAV24911.1 DNA polymerase [Carboxydothermus islandicus]
MELSKIITNPDKLFYPADLIYKKDVIAYYYLMSDYILPCINNRPFVMNRFPDGITGKSFYQKEIPAYAPNFINRVAIWHGKEKKWVNYPCVANKEALLWLVNQGVIELHCWLSKVPLIENPDILVFDLDPEPPLTFKDCLPVALLLREVLLKLGLDAWPKTSGKDGLHLFVPIEPKYSFKETTRAAFNLCRLILKTYPEKVTLERVIKKRTGKVYLDYLQNTRGRTMVFPYSLRPLPKAPVSTPLLWEEVTKGEISPAEFTIKTIWERVKKYGDLWSNFHRRRYDIKPLLELI